MELSKPPLAANTYYLVLLVESYPPGYLDINQAQAYSLTASTGSTGGTAVQEVQAGRGRSTGGAGAGPGPALGATSPVWLPYVCLVGPYGRTCGTVDGAVRAVQAVQAVHAVQAVGPERFW